MTDSVLPENLPIGPGLSAVILGSVSLAMFFMPILGIPLAAIGVVLATVGLLVSLWSRLRGIRWSLAGLALSLIALAAGAIIAQAPSGYAPSRPMPLDTRSTQSAVYVAPPARRAE